MGPGLPAVIDELEEAYFRQEFEDFDIKGWIPTRRPIALLEDRFRQCIGRPLEAEEYRALERHLEFMDRLGGEVSWFESRSSAADELPLPERIKAKASLIADAISLHVAYRRLRYETLSALD